MRETQTQDLPMNIKSLEAEFAFETFGEPKLQEMITAAGCFLNAVAAHGSLSGRWLTLTGRSGTGKTHLASKIAKIVKRRRVDERIITPSRWTFFRARTLKWGSFVDALMAGEWGIVRELSEVDFLFLDEIGDEAVGTREIAFSKFGRVCDARLGKWTVFTSNLGLEHIAKIDARISSRMLRQGNVVVDVGGNVSDYALRRRNG